jgi:hypothetical protein
MLGVGAVFLAAYWLAPVPDFDALEHRVGVALDARSERVTPCRRSAGDCLRTVVDVRHTEGVRSYNFADTPVSDVSVGAAIELWVAPAIRGLDDDRVWQAEQDGRRLRDYERQARADRRIISVLVPLAPLLMLGGLWLMRRDDAPGKPL